MNEFKNYATKHMGVSGMQKILAKTKEQILIDANRDFWLSSEEAIEYGVIDEIITKKVKKS